MRTFPKRSLRRLQRNPRDLLLALVFLALLGAGGALWTLSGGDPEGGWGIVADVVDGDTVRVGRGWRQTTVRLIGVDTPETVHPERPIEFYGPEASDFTKRSLAGQWVRLEFEPGDRLDAYGRLLAYVFLEDGTFFNRELVREGYARAYTRFPFRYREEFRRLEREARAAGLGLWVGQKGRAISAHPVEGKIIGNRRSRIFHVPGQLNYGRVSEENRVYFEAEEEALKAGYRRAKR